jgi:hypothetical protein
VTVLGFRVLGFKVWGIVLRESEFCGLVCHARGSYVWLVLIIDAERARSRSGTLGDPEPNALKSELFLVYNVYNDILDFKQVLRFWL